MPDDIDIEAIIRELNKLPDKMNSFIDKLTGESSDNQIQQQKEAYEAEDIPPKGKLVYDKETGNTFSAEDGPQLFASVKDGKAKGAVSRIAPDAEVGSLYDYELSDKTQKQLDNILKKLGDICISNNLPAVIQIQTDRKGTTAGIRRYRAPEDFFKRAIQPVMILHTCERLLCSDNVISEDIEAIMTTLLTVSMAQDLRRGKE